MGEPVLVIGVGMLTAVGLSASETAASVRTATMRFEESSFRDQWFQPFTLATVPEEGLPELEPGVTQNAALTSRETRMLRLAAPPLAECLTPLGATNERPGVMMSLPEMETTMPFEPDAWLRLLHQQSKEMFDLPRSDASQVGRAGGLVAIRRAIDVIASGQVSLMIAGGVDTYLDTYVLGTLDVEKRVKSAVHLDGFIPGEGAGFLLLASAAAAQQAGIEALARISDVVTGFEDGHLYSPTPYRGDGLASTIQRLLQSNAVDSPIREVYSSMNGENHWAREWGVGFLRNRPGFHEEHGMHHPADCYGDTGAACGPLMVGLAALGIARGYGGSPALVYCSSDKGDRAALAVRTA